MIGLARNAGAGDAHRFRAVQLPYNLAMPEAFLTTNQMLGSSPTSLLEVAQAHGLIVMASASILQGKLANHLPESLRAFFEPLKTDAQKAIQFVRSTPGVTSALVGMSQKEHVEENMQVAKRSPLNWDEFEKVFN
jgi:predicted aldo/keto reductase-like oxidoreductase